MNSPSKNALQFSELKHKHFEISRVFGLQKYFSVDTTEHPFARHGNQPRKIIKSIKFFVIASNSKLITKNHEYPTEKSGAFKTVFS